MKTPRPRIACLLLAGMTIVSCSKSASTAENARPYPLKTCLVSGKDVGSMGRTVTKVYDGQEIKFCCPPCIEKFEARQAEYLAGLK